MNYLGYENLQTGKFTLVQTNIDLKDYANFVKSHKFESLTGNWVTELIDKMEEKNGKMDYETQMLLLIIMVRTYIDSGVEFGNENFYWLRTNGDRFHTIGRKLWKGAKKQDVEKLFKKNLRKDYDHVYQTW